ncbi:MAG: type 4a pilus biogenesis protein PilO [Pseudoclavibacter sp.]
MLSTNRSRILLAALAVAGVFVLILSWFVGVSPQLDALNTANTSLASQKSQNDLQQIAVQKLKTQYENIDQLRSELEAYRQGVPDGLEESSLDRQIDAAASSAGVTITGRSYADVAAYAADSWLPAPTVSGGTLVIVPLTIEATGSLDQMKGFVQNLQTQARYITISGVQYTAGEDNKVQVTAATWLIQKQE